MKPLRLVMEAFGPFRGRQEIDFGVLGDKRLFLIEGDTGSGKTTIFDAMCAALYGQTSVGRSQGHMKSLSAEADAICRLEFAFQVGPRSFRIVRIPEQQRLAHRGGGMTTQAHAATLWETTAGTDHVLATKVGDVSDRIVEILGLSAEQFCQVVLLPQGRFEQMLKAPAQDRENVLKVLFQTDRYLAIQERLAADARQADSEVRDALRAREQTLESTGCATLDELSKRHADAHGEIARSRAARAALGTDEIAARAELEAGREAERKIGEQRTAEKAFKELQEQEPAVNACRLETGRAERAFHISATDANLAEAVKQSDEAAVNLRAKTLLFDGARLGKTEAAHELYTQEKRRPEHDSLRSETGRLEATEKVVAELAGLRAAVTSAQGKTDRQRSRLQSAEKELALCGEKLTALRKGHTEQEQVAASVGERRTAVRNAEQAQERSKQAEDLRQKLRGLRKQVALARKRRQVADARLKKARAKQAKAQSEWVKAQAAVLARTLEPGSPCPVCGSSQHPKPAKRGRGAVDQAELDRTKTEVEAADDDFEIVRTEVGKLESELADAAGREQVLTDGTSAKAASREAALIRKLLDKAEAAAKAVPGLVKEIARLGEEEDRRKLECETLRAAATAAESSLAAAKAKLDQREHDIPAQHRDPTALHEALENVRGKLQALESALEQARDAAHRAGEKVAKSSEAASGAQAAAQKAAQQAAVLQEKLDREIAAEGFASLDDYRAAKRTRQQVKELQAKVARFDEDLAAARARLVLAMDAATGLVAPDLAKLEARVGELLAQLQAADTGIGALDKDIATMEACQNRLADLQKDLAGRESRSTALRRLANVATGSEPRNPGFHRFVLAERLDEVLLAANRRLGPMSDERYRLQRVRDEENRRVAAGLNLEVLDGYSGKTRPVDTLSGGESFQAALSLALGLADVVQQHSGGVKLDTVFVDEGFGSLDPNALELAMRCLEDLRQTGRLVGVISHVAEMKERIRDAQLRVTNVHGVSEARFVVT
ncbi:MAG: SMC family ATPase [Polyangia bacterium]